MENWPQDDEQSTSFFSHLFDGKATYVEAKLCGDGLRPHGVEPRPRAHGENGNGKFVYAVLANEPIPRVCGKSKYLYIGQGNASRISYLLDNKHSATRALRQIGEIQKRKVRIVWRAIKNNGTKPVLSDSCLVEAFLLHKEAEKHGELPPANLRWEGFFVAELLKAMIKHVHGGELRGLSAYDWPASLENEPTKSEGESTWCDHENLALGWLWPKEWTEKDKYTIDGTPLKPEQLVLASREESNKPWFIETQSALLPGLGMEEDVVSAWEAVDKASPICLEKNTPKEKLRVWLEAIEPTT